jgi:hypothetical protein
MPDLPPHDVIVRWILHGDPDSEPSAAESESAADEPIRAEESIADPGYFPPGVMAWEMLTKHPERYGTWPVTDEAFAAINACLDETDQKQDTLLRVIGALRVFADVCRLDRARGWRDRHPNPAAELEAAAAKANELAETVRGFSRETGLALARAVHLDPDQSAAEGPHGWLLAARSMASKMEALAARLRSQLPAPSPGPVADQHVDALIRQLAACYDDSGSRRRKKAFVEACVTAIETSPVLLSEAFKLPEMPTGRALERRMPPRARKNHSVPVG